MRMLSMVIIGILVWGHYPAPQGNAQNRSASDVGRAVSSLEEDRHLGIEYSRAARFKLSSRKKTYRMGEMISLDCAMLNTSASRAFFHNLSGPGLTLSVFDEKGSRVEVTPGTIFLEGIVAQSYSLLNPNSIIIGSYHLLAGCNTEGLGLFDDARKEFDRQVCQREINYEKGMFERELFVNWGDACLRITQPGTYKIMIEMRNMHVVISSEKPSPKTAVGTIASNLFEITITE